MNVETDQGTFAICMCGNPDGHVGAVWHPGCDHPSGAQLQPGEAEKIAHLIAPHQKIMEAHQEYVRALGGQV